MEKPPFNALFAADELADGRPVRPIDLTFSSGLSYWLVYPKQRRTAPKICAFHNWIAANALPVEDKSRNSQGSSP